MVKALNISIQSGRATYEYYCVRSTNPDGAIMDKFFLTRNAQAIEYHRQRESPHYYKNVQRMKTISTTKLPTHD